MTLTGSTLRLPGTWRGGPRSARSLLLNPCTHHQNHPSFACRPPIESGFPTSIQTSSACFHQQRQWWQLEEGMKSSHGRRQTWRLRP
jgi:hypothetical protein